MPLVFVARGALLFCLCARRSSPTSRAALDRPRQQISRRSVLSQVCPCRRRLLREQFWTFPTQNFATSHSASMAQPAQKKAKTERVFLFSSESVNEGHPDKICDQVAAVLGADSSGPPVDRGGSPRSRAKHRARVARNLAPKWKPRDRIRTDPASFLRDSATVIVLHWYGDGTTLALRWLVLPLVQHWHRTCTVLLLFIDVCATMELHWYCAGATLVLC